MKKMDEAELVSKFEIPDMKFADAELEWRPTFKCHGEYGEETYQGQWIKGTFTRCGFGRRSYHNIPDKYRTDENDVWYDTCYMMDGENNGQCVTVWWLGNGPNIEYYNGEMKDDKRHGKGTYVSKDGTKREGTW